MNSLSIRNINLSNFNKLSKLKQGGCGSVYKIVEKATGQFYVAKILTFDNMNIDEISKEKMINREIELMLNTDNPTIIKILGYSKYDFNNDPNVTLIIDYFEQGSLYDQIQEVQHGLSSIDYSNTTRQIILIGISYGMKYLHNEGIIHRDLSSNNILLDDEFHPVITDFGLSKYVDMTNSNNQSFYGGKVNYMAPEILQYKPYNSKTDVYSFAIIMYEVVTDSDPYPINMNKIELRKNIIKKNFRPQFKNSINESLKELIKQCWSNDPNKRPNFDEIFEKLSSPDFFLDGVDESKVEIYVDSITEADDSDGNLVRKLSKNLKNQKEINIKKSQKIEELVLKIKKQQDFIINSIKNEKFKKILIDFSKINDQSENKIDVFDSIFIPCKANNVFEIINLLEIDQKCIENIGFRSELFEMMFSNDSFNLNELVTQMKNFSKITLEIRSSSSNFENILNNLSMIKQQVKNSEIELIHDNQIIQFSKNIEMINSIIIDSNITTIDKNLFNRFSSLSTITIPSTVTILKSGCFSDCSSLKQIKLPNTIEKISKNAFKNCTSLKEIIIQDSVIKIGNNAFENCSSLESINIPFSINSIGINSFSKCTSLTHVFIPSNIKSIGLDSFNGCSSLKLVSLPDKFTTEPIGIDTKKTTIIKNENDSETLFEFGNNFYFGTNVSINKKEAIKYYKMAIEQGNAYAMNSYGRMLQIGDGIQMDKKEAIKLYKMAIEKGNASAMNNFGYMLQNGDGIQMDTKEAIKYYQLAIEKGNISAINNYAYMLQKGIGIPANKKEAIKYYKIAIEKGNTSAMYSYGFMLQNGDGIQPDKRKAIELYKMAIENGNDSAVNNYGRMLQIGDGIPADKNKAVKMYKMAIDRGNEYAMFNYGCMLLKGDGILANKDEAIKYFKMAAKSGRNDIKQKLIKINIL